MNLSETWTKYFQKSSGWKDHEVFTIADSMLDTLESGIEWESNKMRDFLLFGADHYAALSQATIGMYLDMVELGEDDLGIIPQMTSKAHKNANNELGKDFVSKLHSLALRSNIDNFTYIVGFLYSWDIFTGSFIGITNGGGIDSLQTFTKQLDDYLLGSELLDNDKNIVRTWAEGLLTQKLTNRDDAIAVNFAWKESFKYIQLTVS